MEPPKPADLERSLSALFRRLESDPQLRAELARARREFLGHDRSVHAADNAASASALVRFCEWYVLERESEVIGEVPLESLQRRGREGDDASILEDSTAGVFLVERVESGQAQVRDLQDHQVLDVVVEQDSVRAGDLLAGRLYPGPGGEYIPSPVLSVRSDGASLGRAFQRDIVKLSPDRRLTQVELEHLLFRRWAATQDAEPLEHLEAQLQSLLGQGSAADARSISENLRRSPQPGPVMGPILDQLAFETQLDLDTARRVLMQIWNHHASSSTPERETPEPGTEPVQVEFRGDRAETLGQSLARRIEEGLAQHEDIDDLFASVGEMLGEDLSAEDEDPEDQSADDNPAAIGDLEPLVREFLWESGSDNDLATNVLHRLNSMQQEMPVPKTDIAYLESSDLLRLLLQIFLESLPNNRAPAVRSAFEVLESFYVWAERTQEYELGDVLRGCLEFLEDVQRLHDASNLLSTVDSGPAPCLMRVIELHETAVGVVVHGQNEPVLMAVPGPSAAALRTGDLLLGSIRTDPESATLAGMVVVLPGELEHLLG